MKKYLTRIKPICFQVLMVVITLVSSSSYLRITLGSYAVYGLAFGVIVCVATLFDGTFVRVISDKINWLLFAFCSLYLVSIVLHRQSGFSDNIKQLVFMSIFFYLFTMAVSHNNREEKLENLKIVSWIYVVATFIIALVCFYMFLIGFSYSAFDPETGNWFGIGVQGVRLYGLYNPNTGASIFSVSILISLSLLYYYKSKNKSPSNIFAISFNLINVFLNLICVILADSRGATYSFYLAIFVLCFFAFSNGSYNTTKLVKNIAISIAVVLLVICLSKVIQKGLAYLPGLVKNDIGITANISVNPIDLEIEFEKSEIERSYSSDITTGRMDIWKSGISLIEDNLLFGIPYASLKDLGSQYFENNGVSADCLNSGGTFHNILLSCFASSGIFGFITMVVYASIRLIRAFKNVFAQKSFDAMYVLPLVIVIMALCNEMVESRILYSVNILNVMFWIMMGYLPNEKKDAA